MRSRSLRGVSFVAAVLCFSACVDTTKVDVFACSSTSPCAEGLQCCDGLCRADCSIALGACDGGLKCDGVCTDVTASESHCGQCGARCAASERCVEGECRGSSCPDISCGEGRVCVAGACRDVACLHTSCNAYSTCVGGNCIPRACASGLCEGGWACLDGGCVDVGCDGVHCADGGTCALGRCDGNTACTNGRRDVGEADVDCGGTCAPCTDGKACSIDGDCASGSCVAGDGGRVCGSLCEPGATCGSNPTAPCRTGVVSCSGGTSACIDGPPSPDGVTCGDTELCLGGSCVPCMAGRGCSTNLDRCRDGVTNCTPRPSCEDGTHHRDAGAECGVDQVCASDGRCVACDEGASCTGNPTAPCRAGVISCSTGTPRCLDGPEAASGTSCGVDRVCRSGSCVSCVSGMTCAANPGAPCRVGSTTCGAASGCVDGAAAPGGTGCGTDQVCNGNGQCVACAAGTACSTNPSAPCRGGVVDCSNGTARCLDAALLPAGSSCGANQVCDAVGTCVSCTAGQACGTNSSPCRTGQTSCVTGSQRCVDFGLKDAGVSCSQTEVCDGRGFCGVCSAGQPCNTNPTACRAGFTSCGAGGTSCDDGSNVPPGVSCGANQVCTGSGACVACTTGQSCTTNSARCRLGQVSCATGAPVCADSSPKPAGSPCGTNQVCDGAGACAACTSGQACNTNPLPCRTGVTSCTSGSSACVDSGNKSAGVSCGTNRVCDGAGSCVACTSGQSCATNPGRCFAGTTSCSSGSTSCVDGTPLASGTTCGTGLVCNGTGSCVACSEGSACTTNPGQACFQGVISCSSGGPVCVNGAAKPSGTSCGTNLVCSQGACVACTMGQSCTTNPNAACAAGVISCSSGQPVCVDGSPRAAGTDCGSGKVCDGAGFCGMCTAGQSCTGNPSPGCHVGVTSCTTGTTTCVDGAARPPGTVCGTNQVCTSAGACAACTSGTSCTTNPSACRTGLTSCATGTQTCADGAAKPGGTSCGTNQVCNGSGTCVACTAGVTCTTNPTRCRVGTSSCTTGSSQCLDTAAPVSAGTICGTNQVCNGSGSCVACTASQSCTTNPSVCRTGTTSCASGASTCVDSGNKAAGTGCGTNQVCNGSGACVACTAGVVCTTNPGAACRYGVTSCATGVSTCVDGSPRAGGTTCGTNQVCNGAGACVACTAGNVCFTNANAACANGVTACGTGTQQCVDSTPKAAGTSCGLNQVCNGSGGCIGCSAGNVCSTNPDPGCWVGAVSCTTGAPVCLNDTRRPNGTSCGSNMVCNAGTCVACSQGMLCTTNPQRCKLGVISCGSGTPTCVDTTANTPAGTPCGSNQVCEGSGVCIGCVSGAACTWNPTPCREGVTSCATGYQNCVDTAAARPVGTWCAADQYCDSNAQCGPCVSGAACTGNPGECRQGTTSCVTGPPVCTDGAIRPIGTSCSSGMGVCDYAGQCSTSSCPMGCIDPYNGYCLDGYSPYRCGGNGGLCVGCYDHNLCACSGARTCYYTCE